MRVAFFVGKVIEIKRIREEMRLNYGIYPLLENCFG
jgi:hypothetical protein